MQGTYYVQEMSVENQGTGARSPGRARGARSECKTEVNEHQTGTGLLFLPASWVGRHLLGHLTQV